MSNYKEKHIRRSQLISPWGVGAIVSFPNDDSLMIAGLDMWNYGNGNYTPEEFIIKDERLVRRLGIKELRWPPDYREKGTGTENIGLTIPAVRFPRWYYCPWCGTMEKLTYFGTLERCSGYPWENGRTCTNKKRKPKLIPERLVVICQNGHIDDFPIMEYIHKKSNKEIKKTCKVRRTVWGGAPSLSGIKYTCSCGAESNLAGILKENSLKDIYECKGAKPWLGIEKDNNGCDQPLTVVYRNASNVWFPNIISSIYIPNIKHNQDIINVIEKYETVLLNIEGELDNKINIISLMEKVDYNSLLSAIKDYKKRLDDEDTYQTEEDYRFTEYNALIKDSGNDLQDFYCKNINITNYDKDIRKYFSSISLIHKLRETRVLTGFSRLLPNTDLSFYEQRKFLSKNKLNWLPAIEVYGEGIFIEFNDDTLKKWEKNKDVLKRIDILNESYKKSCNMWGRVFKEINPRYVLLHTFAHLLINQFSFECGYTSSSLRERIYCDFNDKMHNMNGILIYTASGDSEGTMGGLVRMGKQGYIENTIKSAIENARWCSSDPICIYSKGQGPDSLNLSACHNCALLPETSCEKGNRFLDRGLLIGTIMDPNIGYFNDLIK